MSNSLPQHINPWLLFRHNETVTGTLDFSVMPNLQSAQKRQQGKAKISLVIERRDDGQMVIIGTAAAEIALDCQRCLQPFIDTFVADFELVLVKYEQQLQNVSDEDDAIVVEEQLALAPLIEQELILALPMIAKHDDCQVGYENTADALLDKQQPFANLKDLFN